WDWATQWSLPKTESLNLVIPGVFGYRMNSPEGGNYWGGMGRDPSWDRWYDNGQKGPAPGSPRPFSGGGNYLGLMVVLIAAWAGLQSFRGNRSVFNPVERKLLWFWVAAIPICLVLAYGRFAPFYQILYALPYFSTIRNPAKFINLLSFSVAILFAYGIHGLSRRYLESAQSNVTGLAARFRKWWAEGDLLDKRWIAGCAVLVAVSFVGWRIYASYRPSMERYLELVGMGQFATEISAFSFRQVGLFVLLFAIEVVVLTLIVIGVFAGRRARWGAILLGAVLLIDLGRANMPWVVYWDYKEKYATNPVIDILRQQPYEHRVALLPFPMPEQLAVFDQLYRIEWAQHHFPYYNIQSLDIIQMPRTPQDLAAFESALQFRGNPDSIHLLPRRWTLTNTRYLLGPAGYLNELNSQLDPVLRRFRIACQFEVVPKPGVTNLTRLEELTAEPSPKGSYALFEFTGVLPRVKLYSHWEFAQNDASAVNQLRSKPLAGHDSEFLQQLGTNDFLTLKRLASPSFDPAQTVLVGSPVPVPANEAKATANPGSVDFTSYSPKDIKLRTDAQSPSILLLNDKYDPSWQVWVDGKRSELLRCNFIMRGVALPAGPHSVEFVFRPPIGPLYVNVAAFGAGILLIGVALLGKRTPPASPAASAAKPRGVAASR
ncbi:MAG TPA: hypothetical protein VFD66_00510, partial [Verrucomicrobiae bacterium]|nr:hypothetical protein [Verrucomicrobiae bacterium]